MGFSLTKTIDCTLGHPHRVDRDLCLMSLRSSKKDCAASGRRGRLAERHHHVGGTQRTWNKQPAALPWVIWNIHGISWWDNQQYHREFDGELMGINEYNLPWRYLGLFGSRDWGHTLYGHFDGEHDNKQSICRIAASKHQIWPHCLLRILFLSVLR